MPTYTATRIAFTPATNADNWTLDAGSAGDVGEVIAIGWGGELTTSTGYRTRWVRPTTAGITITAMTAEDHTPGYSTPLLAIASTWTTQPVIPASPVALFAQSWNAHGGLGYVALPLAAPWRVVNGVLQGQVSCRNDGGTDASGSSYSCTWTE
jgi:hypothetical protein